MSTPRCAAGEEVREALLAVFAALDACFELPPGELERRPDYPDAWSDLEHLEHVSLANHFLLLTIGKGCRIAARRGASVVPEGESDLAPLASIAEPGAFDWLPPLHMLPTGRGQPEELRARLAGQRERCLELLAGMPAGEGRLYTLRMSVQRLGRLDMYQWLYFLAQHARYHLNFMARRRAP